jgi:hypothetical protein
MPEVEVSPDGQSSTYHYGSHHTPSLDALADRALERMAREPDPIAAAANLLMRWAEQDSTVNDLIPNLMFDYLEARVRARAEAGAS